MKKRIKLELEESVEKLLQKTLESKTELLRKMGINRIDDLEDKAKSAGAMLDDQNERLEDLDNRVDDLDDSVVQLKGFEEDQSLRDSAFRKEIEAIKKDVGRLAEDTVNLKGAIRTIKQQNTAQARAIRLLLVHSGILKEMEEEQVELRKKLHEDKREVRLLQISLNESEEETATLNKAIKDHYTRHSTSGE